MGFFARLWHAIVDLILRQSAHAAEAATQQLDVFSQLEEDTLNLIHTVDDLKQFSFNPKWKSRVIVVPRAIDGMQQLLDIVLHGIRDKFAELHTAIIELRQALHGQGLGHFGSPEPSGRVTAVVNWIGQLNVALHSFERAYRKLVDLTTMIDDVKNRIETLDDLFLPQGSTKTTVEISYRKRNASA